MNKVIYKSPDGKEIDLKLTAKKAVELEARLEKSIQEATEEFDKLSVSSEIIAAAMEEQEYEARKEKALSIYDEMLENGKTYPDYQYLVMDILVAAGFMNGKRVALQKQMIANAEKLLAETLKQKEEASQK